MTDCTECRHFVWCDFEKMAFHKITETPCDEFEREGKANGKGPDKTDTEPTNS